MHTHTQIIAKPVQFPEITNTVANTNLYWKKKMRLQQ